MCLGIPMEIVKIDGDTGLARAEGLQREVNLQFLKGVKKGDYVIIHAGYAIEKMDREKAHETLDLYRELRP
ncbi:MAG: HypC/HybG/HupF family hydrogenase formation chaperone [Candidatus Omnitrophica bacterium]|nr:HypC/HybG/HupF family hydrogenase formation chaperone [Candidatus Omnitrophota bacterium]